MLDRALQGIQQQAAVELDCFGSRSQEKASLEIAVWGFRSRKLLKVGVWKGPCWRESFRAVLAQATRVSLFDLRVLI